MVKGTAATPAAAAAATGELNRAVEIWDTAVTRIEADDGQESVKLLTPLLKAAEVRRSCGLSRVAPNHAPGWKR